MRTIIESDSKANFSTKPWKISDLIGFLTELEKAGYGDHYICDQGYETHIVTGASAVIPEPGESAIGSYCFENRDISESTIANNDWKYLFLHLEGRD